MAEKTTAASGAGGAAAAAKAGAGLILFALATGEFLMTLDTSVMNVSIATVADDLGTTVTGVQTAITLYTLVMASLMVLGGKVGSIIGRKKAFSLGCIIYGCGSLTTALAPNLTVLIIGWSFLEGIGAVLINAGDRRARGRQLPARRPRQGLRTHRGRRRDRRGRRPGHRRLHDHVLLVALRLRRRGHHRHRHPLPGAARRGRTAWRAAAPRPHRRRGLVRRTRPRRARRAQSSTWGWFLPKEGATSLFGLSLDHLVHHGRTLPLWLFLRWQTRLESGGKEPLISPALLRVRQLTGGLITFLFQFLIQAGLFFIVPLFLSVVLGLSPMATGVRLLPLSLSLLVAAVASRSCFRRPIRGASRASACWGSSPASWC